MSRIKTNIVNVYFTNLDRLCEIVHFPNLFVGNSINKTRKYFVLFDNAKTNNEMMSSVLSNVLGRPGGGIRQNRYV